MDSSDWTNGFFDAIPSVPDSTLSLNGSSDVARDMCAVLAVGHSLMNLTVKPEKYVIPIAYEAGAYTRPLSPQPEPFLTPKTSHKRLNTPSTPAMNTP